MSQVYQNTVQIISVFLWQSSVELKLGTLLKSNFSNIAGFFKVQITYFLGFYNWSDLFLKKILLCNKVHGTLDIAVLFHY